MISFTKMKGHYGDEDMESVHINTEGKSLSEITNAFRLFLTSCGFQCENEEEIETIKKQEDFFI